MGTSVEDAAAEPRVALVTGASRGIGKATALALARDGLHVVLAGRNEAALAETMKAVEASGGSAGVLVGDLRDDDFWRRLQRFGDTVDVLVHNASEPASHGLVEDVALEGITAVLETVLAAGIRLARFALPGMKRAGRGRIVFVGSAVAGLGGHGQAAYAAAKSGLRGLVRSLALEASRDGVTCNLVEPGYIDTERTRAAVSSSVRDALVARSAVGRAGTAEEVASVIAFLASPAASYVTGACIPVTGGAELGLAPRGRSGSRS